MGLVDYIVPLAEFEARLEEIVRQYLRVCSITTAKLKTLCNLSFDSDYNAFLKKYFELQEIAQASEDHFETRRAYREKRDPEFK